MSGLKREIISFPYAPFCLCVVTKQRPLFVVLFLSVRPVRVMVFFWVTGYKMQIQIQMFAACAPNNTPIPVVFNFPRSKKSSNKNLQFLKCVENFRRKNDEILMVFWW